MSHTLFLCDVRTQAEEIVEHSSYNIKRVLYAIVTLGGLVVSVLATGPKVCGFKPGRGDKNP